MGDIDHALYDNALHSIKMTTLKRLREEKRRIGGKRREREKEKNEKEQRKVVTWANHVEVHGGRGR